MSESVSPSGTRVRLTTGVAGLDTVLHGGLIPAAVYIVQGSPGAGKTILANQICFHCAAMGKQALYVTLLAEPHDRMVEHLKGLAFFDEQLVAESIYYESAFSTLELEGLDGILRLLTRERKAHSASLIVLDGLFVLEESVRSEAEFRKFVNNLSTFANLTGSTILLLTNSARSPRSPEYTMVDGWIELGTQQVDYQSYRFLQVHKFRGSNSISGHHVTNITDAGIEVFPRLESSVGRSRGAEPLDRSLLSTGVADLDRMLNGGVRCGSATLLVGPTGVGKTSFGLQFIGCSSAEEPGLIFGFYEAADSLVDKAQALGISLAPLVRDGIVEILWHPSTENSLDQLGYALLNAVRKRGAKRVFVDGIGGLQQSAESPGRISRYLTALANAMHAEGVTVMFSLETEELIGGETKVQFSSMSAVAQNIVLLRYVELDDHACRVAAIVKVRNNSFDPTIRTFSITDQGIVIGESVAGRSRHAEDVVTGHAHLRPPQGDI